MKTYLVGGAVRDALLGKKNVDRDYVVVGSNPTAMMQAGFISIGKDFPVFLHPKTKEEYALARCEKKTGVGYHGFSCYFQEDVTLEQDLQRRDLTINAMAFDPDHQNIIDPYHGQHDLEHGILRAVSHHFVEDPLRLLRVARFCAQLSEIKPFIIEEKTMETMQNMVSELIYLSSERLWQEWFKAFSSLFPDRFISVLHQSNALAFFFPAIPLPILDQWNSLFLSLWKEDTSENKNHDSMIISEQQQIQRFLLQKTHPKYLVLYQLTMFFCCLKHMINDIKDNKHNNTNAQSINIIESINVNEVITTFSKELKIPKEVHELMLLYVEDEHYLLNPVHYFTSSEILSLFHRWDGNRRIERLKTWIEINRMIHESWLEIFYHLKEQKPETILTGIQAKEDKLLKQKKWLDDFLDM